MRKSTHLLSFHSNRNILSFWFESSVKYSKKTRCICYPHKEFGKNKISPSTAAMIIMGRSANGKAEWKLQTVGFLECIHLLGLHPKPRFFLINFNFFDIKWTHRYEHPQKNKFFRFGKIERWVLFNQHEEPIGRLWKMLKIIEAFNQW